MKKLNKPFNIYCLCCLLLFIIISFLYLSSFYINNDVELNINKNVKYFYDVDELKLWLLINQVDMLYYNEPSFDCEDFALLLQRDALKDGYIISCQYNYYNNSYHIINTAFIPNENKIYCIEPQTDNIYMLCFMD